MAKVTDIIRRGEEILHQSGIMNPKVDSELLYCHITNTSRSEIFLRKNTEVSETIENDFFQLIGKRAMRIPLQHITGYQNFMGLEFKVNADVLIPRSETELLVEIAIEEIETSRKDTLSVLDLCTGSGAIGISLKKLINTKTLDVVCADISEKALSVARENAEALGVDLEFVQGNLFEPLLAGNRKFDMILSNPPYIESSVIPTLQEEVAEHEPILALDGGEDGLKIYRRIINTAPEYLEEDGVLIMEIGYNQKDSLFCLIQNDVRYEEYRCIKDFAEKDRIIFCKKIDNPRINTAIRKKSRIVKHM